MQPWDLQLQNAIAVDSEYRVLERDLKGSIASKTPIDAIQPFRSQSRTLYLESTVFAFWVADHMLAMLFFMVGGEYLNVLQNKGGH